MKRLLCGFALIGLVLALSSEAASAQMAGFINYPAIGGVGVKVWGDYGRGLNDDAAKANYFGGRAELGIPAVSFWLGAGAVSPEEIEGAEAEGYEVTFGGGAGVNLIKGPMVPVKVSCKQPLGPWPQAALQGTGAVRRPFPSASRPQATSVRVA